MIIRREVCKNESYGSCLFINNIMVILSPWVGTCFRRYHGLHFIDEGSKVQRSSMLSSRFEINCVLGPDPYNRACAHACFHANDLICIDQDIVEFY